jgi:hypothetical protein
MADAPAILAGVPAKAGTHHLPVHYDAILGDGPLPAQGRSGSLIEGQLDG